MQHITLKMEVETPPLGFTDPNSSTRMDIDTDEAAIEFRMRNMTPEQQEELLIEVLKHRDTPRTREILKCFTKIYEEKGKKPSETFGTPELAELLVSALTQEKDPLLIQILCFTVKIVCRIDINRVRLADRGCIKAILDTIEMHQDYPSVLEHACGALSLLALKNDVNRGRIVKEGGVSKLNKVLNALLSGKYKHPEGVARACGAFRNLAFKNEVNMETIVNEGGLIGITGGMQQYPDHAGIQQSGCGALWNLSPLEKNRQKIAETGGITRIVTAMNYHLNNFDVQECGCGALWNLSLNDEEENRNLIAKEGGIRCVINAMKAHTKHSDIQDNACGALLNLSPSDTNKVIIGQEGGIKLIVEAMKEHPLHTAIQQNACGALWNLAITAENRVRIAEERAVESILNAMRNHLNISSVQENACGALWNCSLYEPNKNMIINGGGIELFLHAMNNFKDHPGIQEHGCRLFWSLAKLKISSHLVMTKHVRGSVQAALHRHQGEHLIEKLANKILGEFKQLKDEKCEAVKKQYGNLEYNEENRQSILKLGTCMALQLLPKYQREEDVPLIKRALLLTPYSLGIQQPPKECTIPSSEHVLVELPRDVQLYVLGFLDAVSLCRSRQVCKLWKALSDTNSFWKMHCRKYYCFPTLALSVTDATLWREVFLSEYCMHYKQSCFMKCQKIHTLALEAVRTFPHSSLFLDNTMRDVLYSMTTDNKQHYKLWPEMRTIYDILFNNYLTSDVAEVKLKIMELINFVFEQSQNSHHLIDYFTSNQHLFEPFANPLFTLCIQQGKYSKAILKFLHKHFGDEFLKSVVNATTLNNYSELCRDLLQSVMFDHVQLLQVHRFAENTNCTYLLELINEMEYA